MATCIASSRRSPFMLCVPAAVILHMTLPLHGNKLSSLFIYVGWGHDAVGPSYARWRMFLRVIPIIDSDILRNVIQSSSNPRQGIRNREAVSLNLGEKEENYINDHSMCTFISGVLSFFQSRYSTHLISQTSSYSCFHFSNTSSAVWYLEGYNNLKAPVAT